jgi:hypothetical protein
MRVCRGGSREPAAGARRGRRRREFWDLGIGGGDAFFDFAIALALLEHEPEDPRREHTGMPEPEPSIRSSPSP